MSVRDARPGGAVGPHVRLMPQATPTGPRDPIKVLYVVGWKRCGSTVLGDALGELEGFFHAGELRTLWGKGLLDGRLCGCGAPVSECDFWSDVLAEVERSLEERLDSRRVYDWQLEAVRTRHFRALLRTSEQNVPHDSALASYIRAMAALYPSLAKIAGARVIVDTSKQHADAALLRRIDGVEPYWLHLIRDPRAQAHSWRRTKASPGEGASQQMQRFKPRTSTRNWLLVNLAAESLARAAGPGRWLRVRYEDFISDPRSVLETAAELVGEPVTRLPLADDRTLMLEPHHTAGGNPRRFRVGPVRLREDDEWITAQSRSDRIVSTALALPLLHRYGYRLSPSQRAKVGRRR